MDFFDPTGKVHKNHQVCLSLKNHSITNIKPPNFQVLTFSANDISQQDHCKLKAYRKTNEKSKPLSNNGGCFQQKNYSNIRLPISGFMFS